MTTAILVTISSIAIAVVLALFVIVALQQFFGFTLKKKHKVTIVILAALFGALFAFSQAVAAIVWVISVNLAIVVFVLASTRRYLEDHPKGGPANHRHQNK